MDAFWVWVLLASSAFLGYKFGKGKTESVKIELQRRNVALHEQVAELTKLNDEFDKSWDELEALLDECRAEKNLAEKANKRRTQTSRTAKKVGGNEKLRPLDDANPLQEPPENSQSKSNVTAAEAVVKTRTRYLPEGVRAVDDWIEKSDWVESEDRTLKQLINSGKSVAQIAEQMRLDQKDVAYRATRLYFDSWGDLDEIELAPNNQTNWLQADRSRVFEMHSQKRSLGDMAKAVGRTKIAIGWMLINAQKISF